MLKLCCYSLRLPELAQLQTSRNGYICAVQNSFCLVYMPSNYFQKLFVEDVGVSDNLKLSANEILLTPAVCISPHGLTFSSNKPAIIELMKTVKLTKLNDNTKLVPIFSDSAHQEWKKLNSSSYCEMIDDRVVFDTTHFSYFAVIAQFSLPSATVTINPDDGHQSQPVKLTISQLPGFKVEIPPTCVQSSTDVTATVHYDDPKLFNSNDRVSLATPCVALEPHNTHFTGRISITIPIPNYVEIIKENPDIKLQLWYSPRFSEGMVAKWKPIEDSDVKISRDCEDNYLATAYITHFTFFTFLWDKTIDYCMNFFVERIHGRCQVFMTRETKFGSFINFGIAVLLYPFRSPYLTWQNYDYILYDSVTPVDFTVGKVQCKIELSHFLVSENSSIRQCYMQPGRLSKNLSVQADFLIEIDIGTDSEIPEGIVLASLSIEHGYDVHKCNLIKVRCVLVII